MRPDLVVRPQQYGEDRYWVVKDPVALAYFHLRDEEYAILRMLDGRASLAQIKRRFEAAFAPLQVTLEQLQAFFARLHRSGLLLAEAAGQAGPLLERRRKRRRQVWVERLTSPLAIRFSGVDPERLLRWLYPRYRWLFSWWWLAGCLALVVGAAVLAAVQFPVLLSRLPDFQTFFSAGNFVGFVAALALAKGLHEMGHALTCKHFGGQCHEIGIMLLVFTPCPYTDVSDAWMFSDKWQRIAVTAAGVLVEMVLAAVCVFLWWFSEPGLLNTWFLSVVVVCSVNTLLFNGNPLMRYDGYYVLADLVEVPNLAQQSRAVWSRWLWKWCLGVESAPDASLPQRRRAFLAVYGLMSLVYRWLVVIGILWFCHRVLKPYRLEVLVAALAALVIGGMVGMPAWRLGRALGDPGVQRRIRRGRAVWTGVLLALLLVGALTVPVPRGIGAAVVLEPQDARYVYVVVPGTLAGVASAGQVVEEGQELARLVNLDVDQQIAELTGQRNQQRLQLENLRLRLADDPHVAPEIPSAEAALADIQDRLLQRQRDRERLVLRAPVAGTVIPPPRLPARPYLPGVLRAWGGSPLEPKNLGSFLETGTLVCLVGDPERLEAVLVIDQSDMKYVRTGQRVRLWLEETPGQIVGGTIVELAKAELKVAPRELAGQGALPVRMEQGLPRPAETSYQARVQLDPHRRLFVGTRGRAKIAADPQALGVRASEALARAFRFKQ